MPSTSKTLLLSLITIVSLALISCGGSSGNNDNSDSLNTPTTLNTPSIGSNGETGSVGLLLTDGFTDEFDAVNITVTEAALLSDSGSVTIFRGDKTVNLLDYKNDSHIFSLNNNVPAGTYSKIRLTLSNIELVKCEDDASITPINIDTCTNTIADNDQPRLNGNKKLDLNPREDFEVFPGSTLMLEIDIDAEKSIHIVETGNGKYKFRPVVFVNIISDEAPGKLLRINGIIHEIDHEKDEFEICSLNINLLLRTAEEESETTCVDVRYDDNTAIFDASGSPTSPEDLSDGDKATVIGRVRINDDSNDDDDCDDVVHHDDDDNCDDVVHHDDDDDRYDLEGMYIQALVIELGASIHRGLDGITLTGADDRHLFDMSINPGQGITEGSQVTVLIQRSTKIVNKMGHEFPKSSIKKDMEISVDGLLQLSDTEPALLLAELIVIDTETSFTEKRSGVIGPIPDNVCGFNLQTNKGDRSVSVSDNTKVLRVTDTDGRQTSEIIHPDDLKDGDVIDVYGHYDEQGCFAGEAIVVFVPTAVPL